MPGQFEIKKSNNGQFMFNLKAGNHEVILTSELYKEKESATSGVESVRANALDDKRYERKTAKDGSPFFVLKAGNGEVIGKSEMYRSATAMENGIESVKKNALTATVHDLTAN
jgi:uncharacterized protein YegP (UPF0339 family)